MTRQVKKKPPTASAPEPARPLVFSAVNAIMAAIGAIAKVHRHEDEDFWFRKIDEMCDELQPLFVEHHLIAIPEVLEYTRIENPVIDGAGNRFVQFFTTVKTRWHLCCTLDGSYFPFPCVTMGEGMSDMHFSTNAAQTMAFKQMLVQVFCIPVSGQDPEEITRDKSERLQPSYQIPESTYTAPASQPEERGLFDEDFTPPEETHTEQRTRRSSGRRKDKEPQTAVAGVGVTGTLAEALDQTPAPLQGAPLTAGFIQIIRSTLKTKNVEESTLLAHFSLERIEDMRSDQMEAAMAFINNGGGHG